MNTAVKTEKDFFVEILQKQIDWDKFNRLREEYPDWATTKHVHKYLNIAEWYPVSLKHALMLDLDKTKKPLKILDIGSGAGYFLFICRNLGHNVTGLDLPPEKEHFEPMFTFYKRMFEVLNLPKRVYYEIKRLTPLPKNLFYAKFDVITSFMVCFNLWFNEKPWEIEEWDFFLNDLRRHLTKKGKILMSLNKNSNDQFYSQELKKYFVKTGAVINENYIYFEKGRG